MGTRQDANADEERAAGGGLLHRRLLLKRGFMLAGAASLGLGARGAMAQSGKVIDEYPEWMTEPGLLRSTYGQPSPHEADVVKALRPPPSPIAPARGVSMTPLEKLTGIITPNGLHFERHHDSIPDIDPARHQLIIHGLVKQPLMYDVESLLKYPMSSNFYFLECSGNSGGNFQPEPQQAACSDINGLVSCAEWTGVRLSTLLDEAGVDPKGKWIIAEGADAVSMVRSIPLSKAMDDVIIALYQNGERLRPGQGYPMRLLAPGWEGNLNVKWVHRIQVSEGPAHSKVETAEYTDLLPDGKAYQFTFPMGVKSVITHPSGAMNVGAPGLYEVSGLAWSGHGSIKRVEVSADGGKSWADAALDSPPMEKCLMRFRIPWRFEGAPAQLVSRAYDSAGNVQPSRQEVVAKFSERRNYHYNGWQSWAVAASGEVSNVYL